ncbi:MAG: 4-hydroxy-tetrahydrodipicolinate reductase [Bacteroidia bacterium]|nr:4-hydroxy-tetrahydrodipicolinate reductase [Bacteroidia bacterium]
MKVAILGYGKMGKEIEKVALSRGHTIGVIINTDEEWFDKKGLLIKNDIDVAIEFSTPKSAVRNITQCFEAGLPVVVGTTGWLDELDHVKQLCIDGDHTLFYASNFSLGVNIFFELNRKLAQMMNKHPDYIPDIEEIHHKQKLDSPSGTAITIANEMVRNLSGKVAWTNQTNSRNDEIPIISKRIDDVPGTHIVSYASEEDKIEIKHTAFGRKGFAFGALLAAEFVKGKVGIFGMKDMLGF